jgi:hypothetical protein
MELNEAMDLFRRENPMKKTLLAMMMAAVMAPFTFAAQTPAPASPSKTTTAKKHKKSTKKSTKSDTATPAATPKK